MYYAFLPNVRSYLLTTGVYTRCVMAALGRSLDRPPWHHLGLDHSHIFTLELEFVVAQAGFLACFIMGLIYTFS